MLSIEKLRERDSKSNPRFRVSRLHTHFEGIAMFYIEHKMRDGHIVRTYHVEGDTLPTTKMIQQDYNAEIGSNYNYEDVKERVTP